MNSNYQFFIAIPLFLLSLGIGLYNFKKFDRPSKIIWFLLLTEILNESMAQYMAIKFRNNIAEYNIYSLVEFSIVCWYFNNVIDYFSKYKVGFYIWLIGLCFGIIDMTLLQPIDELNSYFLFFEGFCIIGMCLFAFFRLLLKNDDLKLFKYHHFWFISIFLFFWCITYLSWGLYNILGTHFSRYIPIITILIWIVNIITYGGIGTIFLLYPKLQSSGK